MERQFPKTMKDYTVIYSSPSVEAAKNLINEFIALFNIPKLTADDMFWNGVLSKDITYPNFDGWGESPCSLDVPSAITDITTKESQRLEYVHRIMNAIIKGEDEKPAWMKYIEENASCDEYGQMPSTFLYLIPKSGEYAALGERLIEFLYSPNMLITMVRC